MLGKHRSSGQEEDDEAASAAKRRCAQSESWCTSAELHVSMRRHAQACAGMRRHVLKKAAPILCASTNTRMPVKDPAESRAGGKSKRGVVNWPQVTGLRTRQAKTTVDVKFMQLDHVSDWLPRPEAVESPLLCTLSNYVSPDETVLDVIFLDLPKYKTHTYNQVSPLAPLPNARSRRTP